MSEHIHKFSVDVSCACGVMLSAYIKDLKYELNLKRSYPAEIAMGVTHYPHDERFPCIRCERDATQSRLAKAEEALKVYARRYDKDGKCWNWERIACDPYSGGVPHFDFMGDEQDEPWEVAEKALSTLPKPPEAEGAREGKKDCKHVFVTSDLLCKKCGLYFPEAGEQDAKCGSEEEHVCEYMELNRLLKFELEEKERELEKIRAGDEGGKGV